MEEHYGAGYEKERERKRRTEQQKRRQRRKNQMFLLTAAVLIVAVSLGGYGVYRLSKAGAEPGDFKKQSAQEKERQEKTSEEIQAEEASRKELEEQQAEEERAREEQEKHEKEIQEVRDAARAAGCPDEILALLDENEETLDFIRGYAKKKDVPPAENLGIEVRIGEVPLLLQWDERWGYQSYGSSTIAVSGSGPSCMAMVIVSLTNDGSVTPYRMAKESENGGYVSEDNHTEWEFMRQEAAGFHIDYEEFSADESRVQQELAAGHPIICSVEPGIFSNQEHFIVLTGYESGSLSIQDPFSKANSDKVWEFADLAEHIKRMWAYSLQ